MGNIFVGSPMTRSIIAVALVLCPLARADVALPPKEAPVVAEAPESADYYNWAYVSPSAIRVVGELWKSPFTYDFGPERRIVSVTYRSNVALWEPGLAASSSRITLVVQHIPSQTFSLWTLSPKDRENEFIWLR